jgi:hypothetical protein
MNDLVVREAVAGDYVFRRVGFAIQREVAKELLTCNNFDVGVVFLRCVLLFALISTQNYHSRAMNLKGRGTQPPGHSR